MQAVKIFVSHGTRYSEIAKSLKLSLQALEAETLLLDIIHNEKKWIAEKEGARDPLASIGEVRKSAINL